MARATRTRAGRAATKKKAASGRTSATKAKKASGKKAAGKKAAAKKKVSAKKRSKSADERRGKNPAAEAAKAGRWTVSSHIMHEQVEVDRIQFVTVADVVDRGISERLPSGVRLSQPYAAAKRVDPTLF